jgi:hypothetical protein
LFWEGLLAPIFPRLPEVLGDRAIARQPSTNRKLKVAETDGTIATQNGDT